MRIIPCLLHIKEHAPCFQGAFGVFCQTFHIPSGANHALPSAAQAFQG